MMTNQLSLLVSVSLFMYSQTKKNPHLEYTIACKYSSIFRETTKERNAHLWSWPPYFTHFYFGKVVHNVSFYVLIEDDIHSVDALFIYSYFNIQKSKVLDQSYFLASQHIMNGFGLQTNIKV